MIVLVLLPLCFTGRALLTGRVYAPIDLPYGTEPLKSHAADHGIARIHTGGLSDLYMQMIPWQHSVRQSLLRGEWPLWNPYLLCGGLLSPPTCSPRCTTRSTCWRCCARTRKR